MVGPLHIALAILIPLVACETTTLTDGIPLQYTTMVANGTIYYFAYGSNMLNKRMHINNPSAEFYAVAKLEDYRLDFYRQSKVWNGAVSTIVPEPGCIVWGVLYLLSEENVPDLDRQENVAQGWYYPATVNVVTKNKRHVSARVYIEPTAWEILPRGHPLPPDRQPSITYLKVIAYGAVEKDLPFDYIRELFAYNHNGKVGVEYRRKQLGYQFYD